jgi:hypothetical protein
MSFLMTDLDKILLTSATTIFGGLLVYVIGQLLSKFLIEPTQELKKAIGEVRFNLAFHGSVIHTPASRTEDRSQKAKDALMKSSCDLLARVNAIPFYYGVAKLSLGFLPSKEAVLDSAIQLRGLSTYVSETGANANSSIEVIQKRVARIEQNLGLEPLG